MILWRCDRGRMRSLATVGLLTIVFLVVNAQVASAADGGGDLMSPLNVDSSEGVAIDGYELSSQSGSVFAFKTNAYGWIMSGLFTLSRMWVGVSCWAIEYALHFPLIRMLADPAQELSETYTDIAVNTLGFKGLMLTWAFVFGLILFVRGRAARGLGEIALTLLIAAFASSMFVRPDYLLGQNGPLAETQQAAAETAQATVASYDWGGKIASGNAGPCDAGLSGPALEKCYKIEKDRPYSAAEVARPIQDSLTNVLVVKGYMLVQYGRILDPAKTSDRQAYALHLKWVSGGYKASPKEQKDNPCRHIRGPARKYCEQGEAGKKQSEKLPELTPGGQLLDAATPVLTDQDAQFALFLKDLEKAGPVGKACATYAKEATGWRTAGALLLFVSTLLISAIPLSSAFVLLGVQAADAAAAAVGGVTLIWAMLPGPSRQAVWKWLGLMAVSVAGMFVICMFLPSYVIGVDTVLTNGPDVPAERLLALNVLGVAGLFFHRRLLRGISTAGQRFALRMRYVKVGGTHLPGDSSEIGAALGVHHQGGFGGFGLRAMGGGMGRLGTRQRLMRSLSAMADGTGMPFDPQTMLSEAGAEASRSLAPLSMAATGARPGARGAWALLVGRRPSDQSLERMRKPTADGDAPGSGPDDSSGNSGGNGRGSRRFGPGDRYREDDGTIADQDSGEVLHDQNRDRTLLSTRAHNRLVRLRGYRLLHRGGRIAYGSTWGLATTTRRARTGATRYSADARQQLRVWRNTVREDRRAWRRNAPPAAGPGGGGGPGGVGPFGGIGGGPGGGGPGAGGVGGSPAPATRVLRTPPRPAPPPPPLNPPHPPRPAGARRQPGPGGNRNAGRPSPARPQPDPSDLDLGPAGPMRYRFASTDSGSDARRRFVDRMGGVSGEERRQVVEELRRRYGDAQDPGGDGGA
ncbi:hypothetical protein [Streptomyces flavofungini]|uniref:Integral membrane protein n=1 Tax=Streptomyces flavofungini TaxID=68200 RepID=A0ABS0XGJ4_9ACTN|nr:hypothetical protein [Streptomyces flavofungini]MBJ3812334.1 hypothetical protein [Streptomyces flavofungini]GHC88377.1 hypothetical protein GCM10010349_75620 [Streptomyces flavofungini]